MKPVILAVDDDATVLGAVERDLRQRYRADYRIVKAGSPAEGLQTARELAARDTPVALFLVDQRMPGMTGLELLQAMMPLHPQARRVLLTAYADTEVAIAGINQVALDHYLMKPWDPPEQRLYPVLDDLLGEWRAKVPPGFEGVRVMGSEWSPESYAAKEFLSRNRVPYQWIDLDRDATARARAEALVGDLSRLPIVAFPDGSHLVAPDTAALAKQAGLQVEAARPLYDVVVIGGGPAGLANAVYAATEGLRVVLVEATATGGQAGTSSLIENYLGFPGGVTGADLADRAVAQARRFGAEFLTGRAVKAIRREDPYRIVVLEDGTELTTFAVVVATGMSARTLDLPGLVPLQGIGVYYGAAMSEAARYRGAEIGIVGGANSAGQGALFFSRYAKRVHLIVRADDLQPTMSHYLADRVRKVANITVRTGVEVCGIEGTGPLEAVQLRAPATGAVERLAASALFLFIGVKPHTDTFEGTLERDAQGFLLTGADLPREHDRPRGWTLAREPLAFETNIPGVFAAGDVRARANRRVAAAVGEGSAAIYSVQAYLRTV